jgi:hypothetical protein
MSEDRDRRSTSIDPSTFDWLQYHKRPLDPYQALMETKPFEEPEESINEQVGLRNLIADQVDKLSEQDEWLFNVILNCRLSLRFVGRILGIPKTTLARRRDAIYKKIGEEIKDHPLVQRKLNE